MLKPLALPLILSNFNQLQRYGVKYELGAKANERRFNPRSTGHLSTPPDTIDRIDCSGYTRYALYNAGWEVPDGSQQQREWFEKSGVDKVFSYSSVKSRIGVDALYICFIKPYTNGCAEIGHVWFVYNKVGNTPAETMESHGGGGIDSRRWDTVALASEYFEGFRIPIMADEN